MLVVLEDVLGAVAVMHVEVDDRHALQAVRLNRVPCGDRDVVEDAKSHRPRAAGVMPGGAHAAERRRSFFLQNQIGGKDRRARRAQRRLQAPAVHRGVGVQMDRALAWRDLADRLHVFDGMHARELLVGGERRIVALQVLADAGGDQLILDRREPLGALGVTGAHFMLETIGVCDKCRAHDDSSYLIACTLSACS